MARPNYRDLTHEQLVSLLEARDRKKFGLIWERDAIEADRALNSDFVALDEVPELGAGDGEKSNLIIEGDNFDALRALKVAYAGKVKCIYIDPPYNTGNRDFVYNDRFVDKDHNWRHSLWLEFVFQRLTLARELLAQDGAIFVSIDDNEIFHLGLLMNEVFGEANFIGTLARRTKVGGGSAANHMAVEHDYVLAYASKKSDLSPMFVPFTDDYATRYREKDEKGRFFWDTMERSYTQTKPYKIQAPDGQYLDGKWFRSEERFKSDLLSGDVRFIQKKDTTWSVQFKQRMADGAKIRSLLHDNEFKSSAAELEPFGLNKNFSFPKPVKLVSHLITAATNPGDLVLDFFAGSGTTAHAVLKMNAANPDKPPRRFILVSNTEATEDEPDKNLCRDVCRQRVANVISGYGDVPGTGGAFAYLRTRRIPLTRVVRKIEHPQVWLFLQLMHFGNLAVDAPLASGRLLARRTPEQSVFYPTTLSEAILQRLEKECEQAANVTIYTWQPEALAARMDNPGVSILPIPQTLIDRFGARP